MTKQVSVFKGERVVRLKNTAVAFKEGCLAQLDNGDTWALASIVGLSVGCKYKGNLRAGVKAGVAAVALYTVTNGVRTAYRYNRLTKRCK